MVEKGTDDSIERSAKRLVTRPEADVVFAKRRADVVPVDQPMVLIAQQTRSGGTLLLQLLDGHPQLHVRPHELRWPANAWPHFPVPAGAKALFKHLRDGHLARAFEQGYIKGRPAQRLGFDEQVEAFPFLLAPTFHRALFVSLAEERPPKTMREVLDVYFTSYFNAWLDYQNLYAGEKRWLVAFRSSLRTRANIQRFLGDYPDGRHVSLVREPKGWVASSLRLWPDRVGQTPEEWLRQWRRDVQERLDVKAQLGTKMFLVRYETLVEETERVMRRLLDWLGIEFDVRVLVPTYNSRPILANSSFRVARHGVLAEAVDHWRADLTSEQATFLDEGAADLLAAVDAASY